MGSAEILIRPVDRGFSNEVNKRVGGAFKRAAQTASAAFAGVAVASLFRGAIAEAEEAAQVMSLTNAVLKSTEGVAKVTGDELGALADQLSNVAAVDDELVQSAGNVLLTFTKVRNEAGKGNAIFDQGLTAALNLSAALGTDLQSATLQVGKALNDPIAGLTALSRAGVQFTKQQKEQVKALVASGRTLDAQKIILSELTTQVGGAAEAAATPIAKMRVQFDNLKERLGTALMPVIIAFGTFLSEVLIPNLDAILPVVAAIITGFTAYKVLSTSVAAVNAIMGTSFTIALGPISAIIAALVLVGIIIFKFRKQILGAIVGLFNEWKRIFFMIKDVFVTVFKGIRDFGITIINWIIRNVINKLIAALNVLVNAIDVALGPFVNIPNISRVSEITVNSAPSSSANAGDFRNADNNTGGLGSSAREGRPIQANLIIDGKTVGSAILPGVRAAQRARR